MSSHLAILDNIKMFNSFLPEDFKILNCSFTDKMELINHVAFICLLVLITLGTSVGTMVKNRERNNTTGKIF